MLHPLRSLSRYLVFPVMLCLGIFSTLALINQGSAPMTAFGIVSILFSLGVLLLEQVLPHRADWQVRDHQEWQDIGHNILGTAVGASIGKALSETLFIGAGLWLATQFEHGFWPTHWPFVLQVVLVFLLADLGRYVQHRLLHRYDLLWRFHVLHHSVDKLYVLKNARSHIVERITQPVFMFGLLFLMGVPPEVLFWYIMPNSFLGIFDHSNVDARLGPLSYIINGPAEHRLHHSRDPDDSQHNFGSALVFWDMVFGTYKNPRPHYSPEQVGIEGDTTPQNFWGQVWEPFKLPASQK